MDCGEEVPESKATTAFAEGMPLSRKTVGPDPATVVGHLYKVVENIIAELSLSDVKRCFGVSAMWKAAAEAELVRRRPKVFRWEGSLSSFSGEEEEDQGEDFVSEDRYNTWMALRVACARQRKELPKHLIDTGDQIERKYFEGRIPQLRLFHKDLESFIKNKLQIDPLVVFCFLLATGETYGGDSDASFSDNTDGSVYSDDSFSDNAERRLHDYKEFLLNPRTVSQFFKSGCCNLHLSSPGIINGEREVELECEWEPFPPTVAILVLPKFEKVHMVPFGIFGGGLTQLSPLLHPLSLVNLAVTEGSLSDDHLIKCVVVLNNFEISPVKSFVEAVWELTDGNVAIGGCHGYFSDCSSSVERGEYLDPMKDNFKYSRAKDGGYLNAVGMLFCVTKADEDALSAYSIVIPEKAKGKQEVMRHLQKLRNQVEDDSVSCAFMFASDGRGKEFHGDGDVELTCFKQLFPRTPVVGSFTLGVIGKTFLPDSADASHRELDTEKLLYSQNSETVFVFLSFK